MIYNFTVVSLENAKRNLGAIVHEIQENYPELAEISHDSERPILRMTIDPRPTAAKVAIHVADRMLAVYGEPFHISDYDNRRIAKLNLSGKKEFSRDIELVDLLMIERERFFGPSEVACSGGIHVGMPIIGIRAATFQRRRELMIACIEFLNERFFQDSPIQIGTEHSAFFKNVNLPFDYSSLPTTIEGPFHWNTFVDLDAPEPCMALDIWNNMKSATITMNPDDFDRTKPYFQTLGRVGITVSYSTSENSNARRIILHSKASAVMAAAVDRIAKLYTFVKFRLPNFAELVRGRDLSDNAIRKIPATLIDEYARFCERDGFEEWDDGTLWVMVHDCKSGLAHHVHNLCRSMATYYRNAFVRQHFTKSSETALIAAAEEAFVFILEMTASRHGTEIVYVGLPNEITHFLSHIHGTQI